MNDQALARADIRHLQSIYNNAGDRGKIDEVLGVFASDGVLDIPGASYGGHVAIGSFLSGVADARSGGIDLRGARHHLTTCRIEFDDEASAQGWTYFFVMRGGTILQEGLYIDRFLLTDEGWRIAHRRVKILWTLGD
jgi:hypothetical protein